MNTTFKTLTPGATYKVHTAAKSVPWLHYNEQIPGAPIATGVADASGNLTLDLPQRTELVLQGADGRARHVVNSTTRVTSA